MYGYQYGIKRCPYTRGPHSNIIYKTRQIYTEITLRKLKLNLLLLQLWFCEKNRLKEIKWKLIWVESLFHLFFPKQLIRTMCHNCPYSIACCLVNSGKMAPLWREKRKVYFSFALIESKKNVLDDSVMAFRASCPMICHNYIFQNKIRVVVKMHYICALRRIRNPEAELKEITY